MFQGMTAFLEAIDERVEQHAQQQVAKAESKATVAGEEERRKFGLKYDHNNVEEMKNKLLQGELDDQMPHKVEGDVSLPQFPPQPATQHVLDPNANLNNIELTQRKRDHVEEGVAAALLMGQDVESLLLKQKDKEIDELRQNVQRHQAIAEAARQELLQRSLQFYQLEEGLRDAKSRLDEHKAKSRFLLEEKQRECDALRRRLELQDGKAIPVDSKEGMNVNNNNESAAMQSRLRELEDVVATMKQEQERLQAQISAARREVSVAQEQRVTLTQQLEFVRLDLRGAQEALDSEVAAHQQSKVLLQRRQQELNELRAAVEKNGGTFTATGALVALRNNDIRPGDQLLISRQLLEKQNALEMALRDAAEWRRRCGRATHKLEEERTTRVAVTSLSSQAERDAGEPRLFFLRRAPSANRVVSLATEWIAAVDAFTFRFGRLLRRQPVLRIAAAVYILCLHGWLVMAISMMSRAVNSTTVVSNNP